MEKFEFNEKTNSLFKAVIGLKSVREAEMFFRDLCTVEELIEMSDRWQIAQMVNQGLPYREIAEELKVSTTTVARVALWLNNGAGGYRLVLDKKKTHHNPAKLRSGLFLNS